MSGLNVATPSENLPLSGITVIDCGQVIAGPTIAMILGDFGAEVIKVENPRGGDQGRYFGRSKNGVSLNWKQLSRNKKTITLSLSKPAGYRSSSSAGRLCVHRVELAPGEAADAYGSCSQRRAARGKAWLDSRA